MIREIKHQGDLIAIIIRQAYETDGIRFFTPINFSQQLAYMKRPVGYKIIPHAHREVKREVHLTQEVLFLRRGKVKVDLFTKNKNYLTSEILNTGDVILLASGGHGFTMLEESEIVEVKQGPYTGSDDKERFDSTT